ncbi:globin [Candidatus Poriferisodalis sp.]|uniref:globin domain-containing protein n=1 Tax=Candidatus Poriferisodalis sp. TaxID=3101277 RepID=UPI003B02A1D7
MADAATAAQSEPAPTGEATQWGAGGLTLSGALAEQVAQPPTVYAAVGGQRFFDDLVDRFYDAVEHDELLRPMYPTDLGPSRHRLAGFLAQYWGGPAEYSAERGHPRLRMRHVPFAIGRAERDAWMTHMSASLDAARMPDGSALTEDLTAAMFAHFDNAATHLVNRPG